MVGESTLAPHLTRLPHLEPGGGWRLCHAATYRSRLRGLLGADGLPPRHGLLLQGTRSIHTLGMRFPIDLIWLDADGQVLRVDEAVAPRRNRRCRGAAAVIETGAGEGRDFAELAHSGALAMMTRH